MSAIPEISADAVAEADKIFKLLVEHARSAQNIETVDLIRAISLAALSFSCDMTRPGYALESIKRYREFTNSLCDDFALIAVEDTRKKGADA